MASPVDCPIGARATLAQRADDPHALLARLRAAEPVSWLPALDGWLVTRHDLVLAEMRDTGTFTVDDPRFSTGLIVGPSMLTRDGDEHARHRAAFAAPFRVGAVRERFAPIAAAETERLLDPLELAGRGELRRSYAGPLAAAASGHGLTHEELAAAAVEESLRLEPAAAVVGRNPTRDTILGEARIARGDLVRLSIAAANRDPDVFATPDRFALHREDRRHLAFAHGPHMCVGVHLARLEARTALTALLARFPRLRLDPHRRAPAVRGLVFRKPAALEVLCGPSGTAEPRLRSAGPARRRWPAT